MRRGSCQAADEDFSCWNRRGFMLEPHGGGCVRAASPGCAVVLRTSQGITTGGRRCSRQPPLSLQCAALRSFQEDDGEEGPIEEAHPTASSVGISYSPRWTDGIVAPVRRRRVLPLFDTHLVFHSIDLEWKVLSF